MTTPLSKRLDVFYTRKEIVEMSSNATLRVGMCYSHNIPRDAWLVITKITEHGYEAHGQCGASEKVELLDFEG